MSAVSARSAEALLERLVAIYSPSEQEAEAAAALVEWMRGHGYDDAFVDAAGNAVGVRGSGRRACVLLGHIDTFPGFPPVQRQGRKLYGRGSVDAKGPLCAFAVAAQAVEPPPGIRFVVIGAVEEESASSRGARFARQEYAPAYCIIGEPSQWDRITLGYKGRLLLHWRWQGGMTHSAGTAPSPAEQAVAYWLDLQDWLLRYNRDRDGIFQRLDASLRDVNTRQEGVDGIAEMTIGFRLPPGLSPESLAQQLPATGAATVQTRGAEAAFTGERNSALSRHFRRAIRSIGGKPRFVYKTGTSDMNVVGPGWGCPILAYGPGDSALDHSPQEHLDLDDYQRAIRVLQLVLASLR